MCDYDVGETADLWVRKYPKAAKAHRCAVCDGIIRPGRRYLSLFVLFDGRGSTTKCCLPCERIEKRFAKEHKSSPHPDGLVDALEECVAGEPASGKIWRQMLRAIRNRRPERFVQ